MNRLLIACATVLVVVSTVSNAQVPIAFRLDDVQCGYQQEGSMAIIDAFLRNGVPLTIGLITAPPANFQNNYDCHVADLKTRQANFATANLGLEFASHSVTHEKLVGMTAEQQFAQLNNSKAHIESLFGVKVATFLPPTNVWDASTITQMKNAGYTIISDQCGAGQMIGTGVDQSCIVNQRRDISIPFFPAIDGIVHASTGAVTADVTTGVHLTVEQMLDTSSTNCAATYCTIYSQVRNTPSRTQNNIGWSIVMMHAMEFADVATINTFFDALLPKIKATYKPYTIKGLVEAITGGSLTPTLPTTGPGGTVVVGSSSTGSAIKTSTGSGSYNGASSITPATVWITAIATVIMAATKL